MADITLDNFSEDDAKFLASIMQGHPLDLEGQKKLLALAEKHDLLKGDDLDFLRRDISMAVADIADETTESTAGTYTFLGTAPVGEDKAGIAKEYEEIRRGIGEKSTRTLPSDFTQGIKAIVQQAAISTSGLHRIHREQAKPESETAKDFEAEKARVQADMATFREQGTDIYGDATATVPGEQATDEPKEFTQEDIKFLASIMAGADLTLEVQKQLVELARRVDLVGQGTLSSESLAALEANIEKASQDHTGKYTLKGDPGGTDKSDLVSRFDANPSDPSLMSELNSTLSSCISVSLVPHSVQLAKDEIAGYRSQLSDLQQRLGNTREALRMDDHTLTEAEKQQNLAEFREFEGNITSMQGKLDAWEENTEECLKHAQEVMGTVRNLSSIVLSTLEQALENNESNLKGKRQEAFQQMAKAIEAVEPAKGQQATNTTVTTQPKQSVAQADPLEPSETTFISPTPGAMASYTFDPNTAITEEGFNKEKVPAPKFMDPLDDSKPANINPQEEKEITDILKDTEAQCWKNFIEQKDDLSVDANGKVSSTNRDSVDLGALKKEYMEGFRTTDTLQKASEQVQGSSPKYKLTFVSAKPPAPKEVSVDASTFDAGAAPSPNVITPPS